MNSHKDTVQTKLAAMLDGGQAHVTFADAVEGMPAALQGVVPESMPHSAWQIVEHIRFTQRDLLDFCRNRGSDGVYRAPAWPEDYWPKDPAPPQETSWSSAIAAIKADREAFAVLLRTADDSSLHEPFAWGDGQTLLHEALLVLDHAAYHVGELVALRRLLAAWHR